ncbi:unnamed protein product [Protopolystoma xenopodis]|uniref:Uncharacterized protein n=1 Tax=Protopolystoma xenopodis TaxID=117903 RepID=A0A3S5ACT8_9PLAT|nr:unnamed protein product [Protopolystoma xenopodis]
MLQSPQQSDSMRVPFTRIWLIEEAGVACAASANATGKRPSRLTVHTDRVRPRGLSRCCCCSWASLRLGRASRSRQSEQPASQLRMRQFHLDRLKFTQAAATERPTDRPTDSRPTAHSFPALHTCLSLSPRRLISTTSNSCVSPAPGWPFAFVSSSWVGCRSFFLISTVAVTSLQLIGLKTVLIYFSSLLHSAYSACFARPPQTVRRLHSAHCPPRLFAFFHSSRSDHPIDRPTICVSHFCSRFFRQPICGMNIDPADSNILFEDPLLAWLPACRLGIDPTDSNILPRAPHTFEYHLILPHRLAGWLASFIRRQSTITARSQAELSWPRGSIA